LSAAVAELPATIAIVIAPIAAAASVLLARIIDSSSLRKNGLGAPIRAAPTVTVENECAVKIDLRARKVNVTGGRLENKLLTELRAERGQ